MTDSAGRSNKTPLVLKTLAEAALGVLAQSGESVNGDWRFRGRLQEQEFEVRCSGPDLPTVVPDKTVRPSEVRKDPRWRPTYRLIVTAPLTTLDLCWRADSALRILVFSRGDWEKYLLDAST